MSDNIRIKFVEEIIHVNINDPSPILIKIREGIQGLVGPTGPAGTTNHALLTYLDFPNSGHTDFQKKLVYVPEYKSYEIE